MEKRETIEEILIFFLILCNINGVWPLWSGLCWHTEGFGENFSEILVTIKLLYNPRVNKVFTQSLKCKHKTRPVLSLAL